MLPEPVNAGSTPLPRVPTGQGKQGKWSGKTQGIWKVCQNTEKIQGILFTQVANVLILKVKDNFQYSFEAG